MLLRIWSENPYRATRDLDLLKRGDGSIDAVRGDIEVICSAEVEPDGVEFDTESMELEVMQAEEEYTGVRVTLPTDCGQVHIRLQIDIGVGDAVSPPPQSLTYPGMLDFPEPRVLAYSRETVIAEKPGDGDAWRSKQPNQGLLRSSLPSAHVRIRSCHPVGCGAWDLPETRHPGARGSTCRAHAGILGGPHARAAVARVRAPGGHRRGRRPGPADAGGAPHLSPSGSGGRQA